jgi:hypothetical protein
VGPEFADGFVGCEAAKGLESASEVVGCSEEDNRQHGTQTRFNEDNATR